MSIKTTDDLLDLLLCVPNDEFERRLKEERVGTCALCSKQIHSMPKCARCKSVRYCSRECQKEHWSKHKEFCGTAADAGLANVGKALARFFDSINGRLTWRCLESAILYKLRSLGFEFSRETTIKVIIFVGFEPVNIQDFGNIIKSHTFVDSGRRPQGMLQLLDFEVFSEPSAVTKSKHDRRELREILEKSAPALSNIPIVKIDVVHYKPDAQGEVRDYVFSTGIPLLSNITFEADHPYPITIPNLSDNNQGVEKSMSFDSCLEYINMSVRRDEQNQFRARMKMSRQDMKALHMTLRAEGTRKGTELLGELAFQYMRKFQREDIYNSSPETKRLKMISNTIKDMLDG